MNGRTPYPAFLDRIPANDNSQEGTDCEIDHAQVAVLPQTRHLPARYHLSTQAIARDV